MRKIPRADYRRAMYLLGLDPEDTDRALVSVTIEAGKVHATYASVNMVHTQQIGDDDV